MSSEERIKKIEHRVDDIEKRMDKLEKWVGQFDAIVGKLRKSGIGSRLRLERKPVAKSC